MKLYQLAGFDDQLNDSTSFIRATFEFYLSPPSSGVRFPILSELNISCSPVHRNAEPWRRLFQLEDSIMLS